MYVLFLCHIFSLNCHSSPALSFVASYADSRRSLTFQACHILWFDFILLSGFIGRQLFCWFLEILSALKFAVIQCDNIITCLSLCLAKYL